MTAVLTGISSMATRQLLAELTDAYRRRTGVSAEIEAVGGVDAAGRVRAGEAFDLVVLAGGPMAALEREGHLVPGSRAEVVRSAMAIAVREGAPHPAITDGEAVKAAILQARTVGYSTGPSGDHLLGLLQRWGVAEAVAGKMIKAPPGVPVAALLARGDVELGFQQNSELAGAPGVTVLGPLPADIQAVTVFCAAIGSRSPHPDQARALIGYLVSPDTAEAKRRHGMEPAAASPPTPSASQDPAHG